MTEIRDRHVSVLVRPSIYEKLDRMACQRIGRHSLSSAANDILEFYFAKYGAELPQKKSGNGNENPA